LEGQALVDDFVRENFVGGRAKRTGKTIPFITRERTDREIKARSIVHSCLVKFVCTAQ